MGASSHARCVTRDITVHRQTAQHVAAPHAVTRSLAESATLAEATPSMLQAICEGLGWEMGVVWCVDPHANVLRCLDPWHSPAVAVGELAAVSRQRTFAPGIGLPGRIWASGAPTRVAEITRDDNFPRAPVAAREGVHGAFGFPILHGREILGVVEFFSRTIRQPDDALLQMMATIGSQIGQFMERKWSRGWHGCGWP